jgi:hypothetical protein
MTLYAGVLVTKPIVNHEKIQLNGIVVGNVSVDGTPSTVLALKNNADWPIFLKICLDLCGMAWLQKPLRKRRQSDNSIIA